MSKALVGGERGVVEAPVGEIVGAGVAVPLRRRSMQSDLHPMPLSLVVAILRRGSLAGVRADGDEDADQKGEK